MSMLKSIFCALTLAGGLAAPVSASVIRFGSVADFSPYNYLDDEGVLQGFEADLGALICERAALECEWLLAPWDELISNLAANEVDVLMTGMQITAERQLTIAFSDEYFPADPSAIMVMTGGNYPDSASVVGAQVDTLQVGYVNEQGWALATYESPDLAIQAMMAGEITAVVGDQAFLQEISNASPGTFAFVATDVVIGGGIGLGLRQSDDSLKSSLNAAIAGLKADGTLDSLIGTWFDGRDPNYRAQ